MSTIQERVKRLIEYLDMNQASFAKSIDTHQSVLSRALKEGQTFGDALVNKILLAYDNVSRDWLIDGKGGILKTGDISIKGGGNIANTGIVEGGINAYKKNPITESLLELYAPDHIKKTDFKDLSYDEFIDVLSYTLKKTKEDKEELQREVIKLKGELATKDETIKGLRNELAIRVEMITFLQNKK